MKYAFADSEIPSDLRDELYREWTAFRDACDKAGEIMPCIATFRAVYVLLKNQRCKWTMYVDLEGSYWATGCVEVFWEKHNFCPDCGRKIQVVERDVTGETNAK